MTIIISFISGVIVLFAISMLIYRCCNNGLSYKAKHQQTTRFLVGSALAMLPISLYGLDALSGQFLLALIVSAAWMITYPLLYHITNRKSSPDYDNYSDIAFGLYLTAWFSAIISALGYFCPGNMIVAILVAAIEFVLLLIVFSQIVYYFLYDTCIDANGMKIIQDTHYNEIIEFSRSFSPCINIGIAASLILLLGVTIAINIVSPTIITASTYGLYIALFNAAFAIGLSFYIWKKRGAFMRTGIVHLYLNIKEYSERNKRYTSELERRMDTLAVKQLGGAYSKPSTIMMVIGESGARDYMSAFKKQDRETTPWLSECKKDSEHFILFPNSYSCAMHTVQALENALTERNQYNDKPFHSSCSIVDIAHKLGYKVHWYSNQGHLGAADTPITIIADTSDVAKWTKQELNKVQYDQALVEFLDEVDPTKNNFVVLHLKGSHFNFINRYPAEYTQWGTPGVQDDLLNYKNSVHYTDHILKQFYDYGREKLNLQAMFYFSDHATIPNQKRSPKFVGFGHTRIPMFVYLSDEYISLHGDRQKTLQANKDKYFTNDLAYDLMCGIFDISSNHFDETNSLASPAYRYTRDMLLTFEGKVRISDDNEENPTNQQSL